MMSPILGHFFQYLPPFLTPTTLVTILGILVYAVNSWLPSLYSYTLKSTVGEQFIVGAQSNLL